ncbi:MAG: NUDIX hydrolase [Clostridia bacterium]|nr:NUDIX hydrolase [Clostridia bacterium]
MSDDHLNCEEIRCEHLIQDQWIDFRRSAYRFPDGRVFEPYYSYSRRDYAVIVASDEEGRFLCVRQFRQGIRQVTTEFPAGGIERKDGESCTAEQALAAAKRELLEETGCESAQWTHLLTVPSQATLSDNFAWIFRAENCRPVAGQRLDDMELLDVLKFSPSEIEEMIFSGRFQQAVHVAAWLLACRRDGR